LYANQEQNGVIVGESALKKAFLKGRLNLLKRFKRGF